MPSNPERLSQRLSIWMAREAHAEESFAGELAGQSCLRTDPADLLWPVLLDERGLPVPLPAASPKRPGTDWW